MSSLSNDEIIEWDSVLEFVRRTSGKEKADKQKPMVDYFKNRNISYKQLVGKNFKEILQEDPTGGLKHWSNTYKNVDSIIKAGSIQPGDDIYIDCQPSDTLGRPIDENNPIDLGKIDYSNEILDDLTLSFDSGDIMNNIGFQALLGIIIISSVYYIGNYLFIRYPDKLTNMN